MISREDLVEQSVQEYVKDKLFSAPRNYSTDLVELLDAFPYDRFDGELDKNYVALGFNFDDDGRQAELGSDLKTRLYTIEFFIFGMSAVWGRNLANVVKFAADNDGIIPLLDFGDLAKPQIDALVVDGTRAERQAVRDPKPHERHVWVTYVVVEDTYRAALV
jgi:hypothetical protein